MSLKISSYGNFLKLKGDLNRRNLHLFKNELNYILERENRIIINVEGVKRIDRYGIKAVLEMHKQSIKNKKHISIIGSGPTRLYNKFKSEKAA